MSTNHHAPFAFGAPLTSAELNRPLRELDSAVDQVIAQGSGVATTLAAQALVGQPDLEVVSVDGLEDGDAVFIGRSGTDAESGIIASIAGTIVTLTENLSNTHPAGTPVSKSPLELVLARSGSTTLGAELALLGRRIVNVERFGAAGDGTTDDTSAFADAIAAASDGDIIYVPRASSFWRLTSRIAVDKGVRIVGDDADIRQVTAGAGAFLVTADDVHLRGLTLTGPQFASIVDAERAIEFQGTDATTPVRRGSVEGCTITTWGRYGVVASFARDITVVNNTITDIAYAGVMYLSVVRGKIANNTIRNITGTPNAYGISLNRQNGTLATFPRCTDITVTGNVISGVTVWEGIDTHAGQRITIAGNTVTGCPKGIAVVPGEDGTNTAAFAPLDVAVVGNSLYSGVGDGTGSYGISFAGAIVTTGSPIEKATGSIVANVVRGFGPDNSASNDGAIWCHTTQGLVIANNTIPEPSPIGINIFHDNIDFVCSGNTVTDPWSNAGATQVAAIATRSTHNRGMITGNVAGRASKSATSVLGMGIRLFNDTSNSRIFLGQNELLNATTPLSDAGNDGRMSLRATKLGFYSTAPIAKPTVSGSRGGNAALQSLLTALANLGLITDSSS